jgi:hypothetical protein
MRGITLKVDVDTLRGTREGVPRLVGLLRRMHIPATFLFSLGPDHTGRALRRMFRRGFLSKVRRTSVASHYGIRTLLYGTLLLARPFVDHSDIDALVQIGQFPRKVSKSGFTRDHGMAG